jgi:hypothetical protein
MFAPNLIATLNAEMQLHRRKSVFANLWKFIHGTPSTAAVDQTDVDPKDRFFTDPAGYRRRPNMGETYTSPRVKL